MLSSHYPYSCWILESPLAIFAFKQFDGNAQETLLMA